MSAGAGSEKPGWVDGVSVCGGWREWAGRGCGRRVGEAGVEIGSTL